MPRPRRLLALLLLCLILAGLVALASGLPGMRLEDGRPFRLTTGVMDRAAFQARQDAWQRGLLFLRGLLAAIIVLYPLYILACLLTERGRKRVFRELVRFALLLWFFNWFNRYGEEFLARLGRAFPNLRANPDDLPAVPLAVFDPASAPLWVPRLFLILAAIVIVGLAAVLAWRFYRPKVGGSRRDLADRQIADSAGQAIASLYAGGDLSDVIQRCYYQMSQALARRGLERSEPMTPREFVQALTGRGLPTGAVEELTLLFEEARYGNRPSGPAAQARALACLTAILDAVTTTLQPSAASP